MSKDKSPKDVRFTAPQRHVVVCTDTHREKCASAKQMKRAYKQLKRRLDGEKLDGDGGVLLTRAKCFGICAAGPIVVVHPEGVWYGACDPDAIDRIVDEHLKLGAPVEDLKLGPDS